MEPQVDLFMTVPEDRSDSEVLDFVGTVERLLRRGIIPHCTYLGFRSLNAAERYGGQQ